MDFWEILTRGSVWLSVGCWAWAVADLIRGKPGTATRLVWTAGAVFFGVHTVAAFRRFYGWSHSLALEETARQTLEVTGVSSGAGLWFNYAFGAVWFLDVAWWWCVGPERYLRRPRSVLLSLHGFMAFMIFNGTVVFGSGPVVWFGGGAFLWLAMLCLRRRG